MDIDFVFDTACPWCHIGWRRLLHALAERPEVVVRPRWRPFLLNPEMPAEGMDRRQYVERKFGGPRRAARMLEAAESAGRLVGLEFRFERIKRTPNTIDSHRLLRLGRSTSQREALFDALFQAYFVDGEDIGDRDTLIALGVACGLDGALLREHLAGGAEIAEVVSENTRAHAIGMSGVPGFIFNGQFAISGAQEPAIFIRMIDLALETQALLPVACSS
ncbi:DsbA family oxidoreductase [Rhodospirillum rubrum]|uniref:DSBA oxidoreductase n=1 Tax=Rhodospirillum rubrum (strain ATCC 11170 / ATH 1.1.1 / DSM 467 / LMG 4362 / NCIMB 8255 / S1) TaxID=269796 RepID=Q2RT23_RHORT|nr:DsbA family oxidoreductase [Rhodospirillum rubrum]ABC22722.1 DSBA oxidoreductase [Rhodospirillum rubrum ATCC 11170]AEO48442.1 DSBA oxidoreductase [Rhodospirillum rubrum F11]MBK5954321.1 DsbA family oxidoreductase [Rhodospirillum rubrum]QXG78714.1 DsbA family oxidoreductase [Rhodospirillum rubrum]HAP98745.1 DsbA family oxidoreductase [Rhodospirillum rubrum]